MQFDFAADRLARDQSKLRKKGSTALSAKAKREAELLKQREAQRAAERKAEKRKREYQEQFVRQCERQLKIKSLSKVSQSLELQATSIHGEGDKLALPPSVLEFLTASSDLDGSSPWTFRIGLLNPDYAFPASPLIQALAPPSDDPMDEEHSDDDSHDAESDDEESTEQQAAYLDELNYKYLAYTHGTVVEFTQEEGHVGLPEPIANALLCAAQQKRTTIATKRTKDPAGDVSMDEDDEKTPGHYAWGAFDLPDLPIEITLLQLPKGKACTLTPTKEAIENGFYNLTDVKLVLEQSLIRTRATLSVNDIVHTWHRGTKFDLTVTSVYPSSYNAVLCINTDIEVDFGENKEAHEELGIPDTKDSDAGGHRLGDASAAPAPLTPQKPTPPKSTQLTPLAPEPPIDQAEGVCTIQIRADGKTDKRRFDVGKATVKDLYDFASSLDTAGAFQLVTRFPRRVIAIEEGTTLEQAGLKQGQELLMLEKL